MSEIATWSMIRSKIPSFPAPTSGRDNECLTKSEILSMGTATVNGNYGDGECVMIDDVVRAKVCPLQYDITIRVMSTGVINLSGYIQEITFLRIGSGGIITEVNRVLKEGETCQPVLAKVTFNGNSISFYSPFAAPASVLQYTFSIDEIEYTITVTTKRGG